MVPAFTAGAEVIDPLSSLHQICLPVTGSYAAKSPPASPTKSAPTPNAACTVPTPEHERCDQSFLPSSARKAKIIPSAATYTMPRPTTAAEANEIPTFPTSPAHCQVRPATLVRVRMVSRLLKLVWVDKNPYCVHSGATAGKSVPAGVLCSGMVPWPASGASKVALVPCACIRWPNTKQVKRININVPMRFMVVLLKSARLEFTGPPQIMRLSRASGVLRPVVGTALRGGARIMGSLDCLVENWEPGAGSVGLLQRGREVMSSAEQHKSTLHQRVVK